MALTVSFDSEVLPDSYRVYRKGRSDGYGGTLVGIKREYLINTEDDCKICAVKLKMSAKASDKMILISVYRPPNRDTSNYIYQLLCNTIYSDLLCR